jgi:hypothetical protein
MSGFFVDPMRKMLLYSYLIGSIDFSLAMKRFLFIAFMLFFSCDGFAQVTDAQQGRMAQIVGKDFIPLKAENAHAYSEASVGCTVVPSTTLYRDATGVHLKNEFLLFRAPFSFVKAREVTKFVIPRVDTVKEYTGFPYQVQDSITRHKNRMVLESKQHSLHFRVNPLVQEVFTNRYTSVSNEFIEYQFNSLPAFEAGAGYQFDGSRKWGLGIGTYWIYARYQYYLGLKNPIGGKVITSEFAKISVNSLDLRVSGSYRMNKSIRLHAALNFMIPYQESTNAPNKIDYTTSSLITVVNPDTIYTAGVFKYHVEAYYHGWFGHPKIIPEINADFQIWKGLNISVGCRWKFWSFKQDYHQKVEVTGYSGIENNDSDEVIHRTIVDSKVFSIYAGFIYEIPLRRKGDL